MNVSDTIEIKFTDMDYNEPLQYPSSNNYKI